MPPTSCGVDLAAEHVALDRDAERVDADDRELALRGASPMSIWMPSIEPENSRPAMPWMPVTLAERMRMKFVGSALMSGQRDPDRVDAGSAASSAT